MSCRSLNGVLEHLQKNAPFGYSCLLRQCVDSRSLWHGQKVHAHIVSNGHSRNQHLIKLLVHMYGHCGDINAAKCVFDTSPKRDAILWNTLLGAYYRNGCNFEALNLFFSMDTTPDDITFTTVLRVCTVTKALTEGIQVHREISSSKFAKEPRVQNALIHMYAKCGDIQTANAIFDGLEEKDLASWNSIIVGYSQAGKLHSTLVLYRKMQQEGVMPNGMTVSSVLGTCTSFEQVNSIHTIVCNGNFSFDAFVQNALVSTYAKCGYLNLARRVFDKIPRKDVVSWNTIISAYTQRGHLEEALELYKSMDVEPDGITFAAILVACAQVGAAQLGREVHERIETMKRFRGSEMVNSALVHMYCRLGLLNDARTVFEGGGKNVASWNALIGGYTQQGQPRQALDLFNVMDVKPDMVTFTNVLVACTALEAWELGVEVAERITKCGALEDEVVATSLLTLYSRCGKLEDAENTFQTMQTTNVIVWNAMFAAYAQSGDRLQADKALSLAFRMDLEGLPPDEITFIQMLTVCATRGDLKKGKSVHERVLMSGYRGNIILGAAIVSMYGRGKALELAKIEFDKMNVKTVITWNALMSSYAQAGRSQEAMELYLLMSLEGVKPDASTFSIMLSACSDMQNLSKGKAFHHWMVESGYGGGVLEGAVLNMYIKCGQLEAARKLFEILKRKHLNSWNAMITAYAQAGQGKEALELFEKMELEEDVLPDGVTFTSAFTACLSFGGWKTGQKLLNKLESRGITRNVVLETAIFNMYAKCGSPDAARDFFGSMKARNTISWNALICSQLQPKAAVEVSQQAALEGVNLDESIHSSLLVACSRSGLVEDCYKHFVSMAFDWAIVPGPEHYRCIADALGRAGKLVDGKELVDNMPFHPDVVSWRALLGSSRVQGQVEVASHAAEAACGLDDKDETTYLLLSNSFTGV